jgi:predicted NAD-dependent protein-ADP-ribosyltransferase YbiA (DUF1768 family)
MNDKMKDKLVFYSKSVDKKPGFGTFEEKNQDDDYSELEKIKDWRIALDNVFFSDFIIDNNKWNSAEHFFHTLRMIKFPNNKIKIKNYEFYKTSLLGSDFYSSTIPSKLQKIAFLAKFTQNLHLKQILLSTNDAELWHYSGGTRRSDKGIVLVQDLMNVRSFIRKYYEVCDLATISQFSTDNIVKLIK